MSQHRFPPLFAKTFTGLVVAALMTVPVSAAAPSASARAASLAHPVTTTPSVRAAPLSNLGGIGRPHREVFGYVNASNLASGSVGYTTWDFTDLSTIALFGLHVYHDGSFSFDSDWNVWNSSALTALMNFAHPRGVKVVPSIIFHDFSSTNGGATLTPMCEVLTPSATNHTASDVASEVSAKGADGFNLDYEGANQLCPNGKYQSDMLVSLVQQLRTYLPRAYISISTYNASYYSGDFFNIAQLNPYVDLFFVMDYDLDSSNYSSEPLHCAVYCFSPTAPLNSYRYNDTNSITGYLGLVPASKIILGVPYYGYSACIDPKYGAGRPGSNAVPYTDSRARWSAPRYIDSSTTNGQTGVSDFATSYDQYTHADSYSTWWDSDCAGWKESYWNDTYTLNAKYDLINRNNLRGVGIFTLDYGGGAPALWQALHDKFGGCIGAGITSSPASPEPAGALIHFSATSTACSSPLYEYWLEYPNGTWAMKRGFSTSSTWDWNSTGATLGTYTVHAWANQSGDPQSAFESYGEMTFTLAVVPHCATATVTPGSVSQLITTSVSFSATSTGCGTPQYEYWVQYPNGTWYMKRPFSSDPTWTWSTALLPSGSYTVHAWANQYGDSTTNLEAVGVSGVTMTGCTSASVSPANPSQAAGSTVTFMATSGGCPNPAYEYWVQYPDGKWYMKRVFSGNAAWSWSTAGLRPGTYTVHSWSNQVGSDLSAFEIYGTSTVTLTGCSSATLSPSSPTQLGGSTIAFTASSAGCPSPQYEYWVKYPNGTWYMKRAFSSNPSWSWSTTGLPLGTYMVNAWANQRGADTSAWEIYGSSTVRLAPPCSSASVSPSSGSTAAGTPLTFTATATGCPNPLYEFWIEDIVGIWHMVQGFSTSPTWLWNTTGFGKGLYHIHVWANEPGSNMGTYEVLGASTRTIT